MIMKIQKFNEAKEPLKKYHICMMVNSEGGIDYSGVFETEEDMDNWILNVANELFLDRYDGDDGEDDLFTEVAEAINWIQDENDCNVNYDSDTTYYGKVKLKYGIDVKRDVNKYNI